MHSPNPTHTAPFRRGVAVALSVAVAAALAGCSSAPAATDDQPAAVEPATIDFQLSWSHSVEWAASYMAEENGHFDEESLTVNLLPGGPNTAAAPVVASGKATIGNSTANSIATANGEGADLVIVAAEYQFSPWSILSLADAPISEPEDLIGKRVAVAASSQPVWNAFLVLNDIDPADVTVVPMGFDLTPLTTGEADAAVGYYATGPVQLAAAGLEGHTMLLSDHGFTVPSHAFFVTRETLETKRDALKRFLLAEIRGVKDYIADVDTAAEYAVNDYGTDLGLDLETQVEIGERQLTLISSDETAENGLLYLTPEMQEQTLGALDAMGVEAEAGLFDMSILDEIYAENPELIG
jgi:ABC-type nitrate/sulfonate/bicarbonate transport system substrate-binding protein